MPLNIDYCCSSLPLSPAHFIPLSVFLSNSANPSIRFFTLSRLFSISTFICYMPITHFERNKYIFLISTLFEFYINFPLNNNNCCRCVHNRTIASLSRIKYVWNDWILIGSVVAFRVFVVDFKNWKCSYDCLCGHWLLPSTKAQKWPVKKIAQQFPFCCCCCFCCGLYLKYNAITVNLLTLYSISRSRALFQSIMKVYWVRPSNKGKKKPGERDMQAKRLRQERERATKNHQQI